MGAPGIREAIFQHMKAHMVTLGSRRPSQINQDSGIYFPCWNDVAKSHKGDKGANYRMRLGCLDLTVPDNA